MYHDNLTNFASLFDDNIRNIIISYWTWSETTICITSCFMVSFHYDKSCGFEMWPVRANLERNELKIRDI